MSVERVMSENDWRRGEIRWTQENHHPHGCGDRSDSSLCAQNLDGTCTRETCAYYGLAASPMNCDAASGDRDAG